MAITTKIEQTVNAVLLVRVGGEVREASPEDLAAFGYVKADKKATKESAPEADSTAAEEEDLVKGAKEFFESFGIPVDFVSFGDFNSRGQSEKREANREEARKQADEFAKKVEESKQEINDFLKKGASKAADFFSKISEDLDSDSNK